MHLRQMKTQASRASTTLCRTPHAQRRLESKWHWEPRRSIDVKRCASDGKGQGSGVVRGSRLVTAPVYCLNA